MPNDVLYEASDHLATITLNRPKVRNAYSAEMVDELVAAFARASRDPSVRVAIVTGAGSAFCAGGDLKLMQERGGMFGGSPAEIRNHYLNGIHQIPRIMARFDKPIIAAVNGPAIGAGLDLACMCDIRVAARSARFGSTFVRVGLIPGDGGAHILARTVGFPRALEMMLSARVLDSDEAERIGLVHTVVDDEELGAAATARAEKLAALPPVALRLTKSAAYRSWHMTLDQALDLAATYQSLAHHTDDHIEGVTAMLEKRKPEFTGS